MDLSAAVLRIAFWLPIVVCTWLALTPQPPGAEFEISDAVLHVAAFGYLAFAARLAFPARSAWTVASWMLGYGALIEIVQGLGGARTAEWRDLLMDSVGIAAGLAAHALVGEPVRRLIERAFKR